MVFAAGFQIAAIHFPIFGCTNIKRLFIAAYEAVQFVQVDICQNWADPAPLRCAGIGFVVLPLLHIPGPKEFPDEGEKIFVTDARTKNVHHNVVVKAIKAGFDVAFHEPYCALEGDINMLECSVTAPFGSESMGIWGKSGFVNAFENHTDDLLHQLVLGGGNAQRPFLGAVFLSNVFPSGRIGLVAVIFERSDDFLDAFIAHPINGLSINPRRHIALPSANVVIGKVVKLGVVQVAVESLESVRFVV